MSADNVIYIKYTLRGSFVWHDFMSNENPKPPKHCRKFIGSENVMLYAQGLMDGIGYVEGGIQTLK